VKPFSSRLVLVAILAVGIGKVPVPLAAQEGSFADRSEVVSVEVPVQVTRDGGPVRGLTAADFVLTDNGHERTIDGFRVVDLLDTTSAAAAVSRVPATARRHFLLLFDLSFSDPSSIERARRAGHDLVSRAFHPSDMMAVADYTAARGAELVLGFTNDRQAVARALDLMGTAEPLRHVRDPLALTVTTVGEVLGAISGGAENNKAERRRTEYDGFRDMQTFEARSQRERQERDILALASSFEELGKLMRGVAGRKQVVFLSEGFDSSIVVGTEDIRRQMEIASESMAGEVWRVDSEERFGSNAAKQALEMAIEEFRRADCAIQAVDIGGVRGPGDTSAGAGGQDGLFILADRTGGELYRNYNQVAGAMDELIERTGLTYILAFSPADLEHDGSFHNLKVKLVAGPRGARVVHRPGYFAPRPYSELSAAERRIQTAGLVTGGEPGGEIPIDVLAAPFPGLTEAYVPVLLEIDGPSLLAAAGDDAVVPLEIYIYAISESGRVADYAAQALTLDLGKLRQALAHGGYKFWAHFQLAPDRYVVRALVRNVATGETGLRLLDLAVPDPAAPAPWLLPPLFADPGGRWLIGQEAGRPDVEYPFSLGGEAFVPAARAVLRRGQPAALSLFGFHLGDGDPAVSAELIGAGGAATPAPGIVIATRETVAGQEGWIRFGATMSELDAEPGDYRLVVTLRSPDGVLSSDLPVTLRP
jgi:VWFA-related protein